MRKALSLTVIGPLFALLALSMAAGAPSGSSGESSLGSREREVLRRMDVGRKVTYSGRQKVALIFGKKRVEASVSVSQDDGWLRTEILSAGPMKGRVVLERGRHRFERRPGDEQWHSRPGISPPRPWRMLRNYTVRVAGSAQVAGIATNIAEVKHRRTEKLARKFWVDRAKGVVLRTEVYSWAGQLVSTTEFEEIDYSPRLCKSDFEVPESLLNPPKTDTPTEGDTPRPKYLPDGYVPIGAPSGVPTERGSAVHFRYSDGLNTISAFVRKLNPDEPRPPRGGRFPGPFSGAVQCIKGDYRVTVMGDLNPAELRRMGESVAPADR